MEIFQWVLANGPELISGVVMTLSGVIAVAMIIPGDQPEKALKGIVEFLARFSKK